LVERLVTSSRDSVELRTAAELADTIEKFESSAQSVFIRRQRFIMPPAAQMTPPASTAVAISNPLQNTTLTNSLRGNASLHALHAKM
jgi:hypothetical protein